MVDTVVFWAALLYFEIGILVFVIRQIHYLDTDANEELAIFILWPVLFVYLIVKTFAVGCFRLAKKEFL